MDTYDEDVSSQVAKWRPDTPLTLVVRAFWPAILQTTLELEDEGRRQFSHIVMCDPAIRWRPLLQAPLFENVPLNVCHSIAITSPNKRKIVAEWGDLMWEQMARYGQQRSGNLFAPIMDVMRYTVYVTLIHPNLLNKPLEVGFVALDVFGDRRVHFTTSLVRIKSSTRDKKLLRRPAQVRPLLEPLNYKQYMLWFMKHGEPEWLRKLAARMYVKVLDDRNRFVLIDPPPRIVPHIPMFRR
jgi:hypothetical protein